MKPSVYMYEKRTSIHIENKFEKFKQHAHHLLQSITFMTIMTVLMFWILI